MGKSILMLGCPMNPPWEPELTGYRFGKYFYNIAKYRPLDQAHDFNSHCGTFVVGSDQLWHWWPNRDTGTYYFFLDWAEDEHKKIAHHPEEMRFRLCCLMSRFDHVSVRERGAVQISRYDFGIDAEQTMYPVFLCPMEDWERASHSPPWNRTCPLSSATS